MGAARAVRIDPAAAHRIRVAGHTLSYPAINAAAVLVLLVALVGAIALARMIRTARRCLRDHRRFAATIAGARVADRDVMVAGEPVPVRCFASDRAEAFCAGLLRPHIYLSTPALAALTQPELAAVVAHERHHQLAHDPLRSLLGRLLARGLFFLPALGRLQRAAELRAEIDADALALHASGGHGQPLAAAMLNMSAGRDGSSSGISPERLDHLLGQPGATPLPLGLIGLALVTVTGMVAVLWQALHVATISATFGLPLVSRQPCVLVLAGLPALLVLIAMAVWPGRRWRPHAAGMSMGAAGRSNR
jgi:hypothetical protein